VPNTADNLFVPSTSAAGEFGKPISKAGSWTIPPPPAIESTNPARNEAERRNKPVASESSANTFT
jgi:hypothetical protein